METIRVRRPGQRGTWTLPAAICLFLLACAPATQATHEVSGVLVEVRGPDFIHAEGISVRTTDGSVWSFRVGPEVASDPEHPATAAHLRQHMTNAERVVVRYRDTAEGALAIQVRDADAPSRSSSDPPRAQGRPLASLQSGLSALRERGGNG